MWTIFWGWGWVVDDEVVEFFHNVGEDGHFEDFVGVLRGLLVDGLQYYKGGGEFYNFFGVGW
jgi:hypothetical protein